MSSTTKDSERETTERTRDRGGQHKSVTMAPTSCFLTDRRYVMRRPLFSAEQYTSILKKTHLPKQSEEEKQLVVGRREESQQQTDTKVLTKSRAELTSDSFCLSHGDITSLSAARENLSSPLAVSELRASLNEERPLESPFPCSRSAQQSLSSSILEVQRLNTPLRPPLTSTVLYPTYTPRSGRSRPGQMQQRFGGKEGRGGGETKLNSPTGHSRERLMSPYQANYWACAIPKSLPPSPDRHSAGWDPNREYQALLDYTYPLRPGQVVTEWDGSKLQDASLLQKDTDPSLQDSGIELDHLYSSTTLSGLVVSGTEKSKEKNSLGVGHRSPDLQDFTKSSDGLPSSTPTDPIGWSLESLDTNENRGNMRSHKSYGHHPQPHSLFSSTSTAFIHSTSVLPQSKCVCGEVDEEFRPLPEQLEELQLLSRQVREVAAQLSRPVTASWESLTPGTTSFHSSITLPEKQEADGKKEESEVKDLGGDNEDKDEGKYGTDREEISSAQTTADNRDSEAVRRTVGASSLREVEALVEQLCDLALPGSQTSSQENQEQSDSLMQRIQVFCSHLEQLIQQLHSVSEKMELLAEPTVDENNMRLFLAEHQSFQREVSSNQSLTSCVLHTGQLLLSCINTMSPFLRDTLLLIERQSGALETQTEDLFSSILSAMDGLIQPKRIQQNKEEDQSPLGGHGSIF